MLKRHKDDARVMLSGVYIVTLKQILHNRFVF